MFLRIAPQEEVGGENDTTAIKANVHVCLDFSLCFYGSLGQQSHELMSALDAVKSGFNSVIHCGSPSVF
jgi:hypothetical protein